MKNKTNKTLKKFVLNIIIVLFLEFSLIPGIVQAQETNYNKTNSTPASSFVERNNNGMSSNNFNNSNTFENYGYSSQFGSNIRLNLSGITENDNGLGEIIPVSDGIYILILLSVIYFLVRFRKILKK